MKDEYSPRGTHVVFDLYGVNSEVLNNASFLKEIYENAIKEAGATIRGYMEELFEPSGITFTFILSESHASCHTYPQDECLMGCIHTCGSVDPNIAVDLIIKELQPKEIIRKQIPRGR